MTDPAPASAADAGGKARTEDWDTLWTLFEQACELEPDARSGFLEEACGGDAALRKEVEGMLAAASDASGALEIENKLLGWQTEALPTGAAVGPYRLVRLLARGGMGEVYLAERADGAYDRTVAIKLLRPGLESTGMVDRFFAERDVLARLTHPAVVPLLDAGITAEGRPYLVLAYVEGEPITVHCDRRGLSRRARLRLFAELCRVVQYAHSNLIVHRDLKPSNVMVDPSGEVRLLDFGIAKLLSADPASQLTGLQAMAPMTPARAAPEQLAGAPAITATDVWALGLLLHELVTGSLPFDDAAGPAEKRIAVDRETLPHDLAAVVQRAVAARPEDRYAAAGELADEVERWLQGKPVHARPDSLAYRAQRFVGRHRLAVALGSLTAISLLALTAVSALQSARAARASERAEAEERKARAVVDFLVETFASTDPYRGAIGDEVKIGDLLARGEERADGLGDQPEVQAALRRTLGRVRLERGSFERARDLLAAAWEAERARLGSDDPRTISLRLDLARALHASGGRDRAEQLLREALATVGDAPDATPATEVALLQGLGSVVVGPEAIEFLERAVALYRGIDDRDPVSFGDLLTTLAVRRGMAGDRAGARAAFEESLPFFVEARGADSPRALAVRSNLAQLTADPAVREAEHRAVLELRLARLGASSHTVATSWHHLGTSLADLGRHAEAAEAFRRALAIWAERGGPGSPLHRRTRRSLAGSLWAQGLRSEAESIYGQLETAFHAAGDERALTSLREERERLGATPAAAPDAEAPDG